MVGVKLCGCGGRASVATGCSRLGVQVFAALVVS